MLRRTLALLSTLIVLAPAPPARAAADCILVCTPPWGQCIGMASQYGSPQDLAAALTLCDIALADCLGACGAINAGTSDLYYISPPDGGGGDIDGAYAEIVAELADATAPFFDGLAAARAELDRAYVSLIDAQRAADAAGKPIEPATLLLGPIGTLRLLGERLAVIEDQTCFRLTALGLSPAPPARGFVLTEAVGPVRWDGEVPRAARRHAARAAAALDRADRAYTRGLKRTDARVQRVRRRIDRRVARGTLDDEVAADVLAALDERHAAVLRGDALAACVTPPTCSDPG